MYVWKSDESKPTFKDFGSKKVEIFIHPEAFSRTVLSHIFRMLDSLNKGDV